MIVSTKSQILIIPALLISAAALLYACSKSSDGDGDNNSTDEFKKTMLINYADNLIIPSYTDLSSKLSALETSVNAFLDAPSATTQTAVKAPFKTAWLSYENVSA